MEACVGGSLEQVLAGRATNVRADADTEEAPLPLSVEERLAALMRQRQDSVQKIALETMRAWREDAPIDRDGEGSPSVPRKG
jgi:hypothetical protein